MRMPLLGGKCFGQNGGKSDRRLEGRENVGAGHLYAAGDDHYTRVFPYRVLAWPGCVGRG